MNDGFVDVDIPSDIYYRFCDVCEDGDVERVIVSCIEDFIRGL